MFEGESMLELARNVRIAEETYINKERELGIIKHKLFKDKDISHWKMKPEDERIFDQTTLMHNKKLSFPDRKSTRLNSSPIQKTRIPTSS